MSTYGYVFIAMAKEDDFMKKLMGVYHGPLRGWEHYPSSIFERDSSDAEF